MTAPRIVNDDTSEAIARKIMAEKGPVIYGLIREAKNLASGAASKKIPIRERAERMIDIATLLSDVITPYTPCGSGCSHCCHMAVAITDYEAKMIGRYVGRDPKPVGETIFDTLKRLNWDPKKAEEANGPMVEKYTGKACTFLKEGKCSIYPVRPIACRTHHNLNDNSDNCIIKGVEVQQNTPALNLSEFLDAHGLLFNLEGRCKVDDIRDFFPPEEAT